jgi:hypothetical protein
MHFSGLSWKQFLCKFDNSNYLEINIFFWLHFEFTKYTNADKFVSSLKFSDIVEIF